jgi:hypothetical protein
MIFLFSIDYSNIRLDDQVGPLVGLLILHLTIRSNGSTIVEEILRCDAMVPGT